MSGSIKIKQPPVLPGDKRYEPAFQYECSEGHRLEAESAQTRCAAYHLGSPCSGDLRRVGTGSRGPR